MLDSERVHHCAFDPSPIIDDALAVLRCELQPQFPRVDKCIKSATISNIKCDCSDPLNLNLLFAQVKKRRNVSKRSFNNLTVCNRSTRHNPAGRDVESDLLFINELCLDDQLREGNDRMSTHRAVAFVVQEEDV